MRTEHGGRHARAGLLCQSQGRGHRARTTGGGLPRGPQAIGMVRCAYTTGRWMLRELPYADMELESKRQGERKASPLAACWPRRLRMHGCHQLSPAVAIVDEAAGNAI